MRQHTDNNHTRCGQNLDDDYELVLLKKFEKLDNFTVSLSNFYWLGNQKGVVKQAYEVVKIYKEFY